MEINPLVKQEFFKLVDKDDLQINALASGFELIGSEENILPNGKSLLTFEFAGICLFNVDDNSPAPARYIGILMCVIYELSL